jgi:inorganic triphosphatase YgiF
MHGTVGVSHKEIEVKLELAPATLLSLKKIPLFQTIKAAPKRASQVSVYFDTDKHKLRQKGLMLRVRREGRRYTQTIKSTTNSRLFERDEWETEIAGKEPDLNQAIGTVPGPFLSKKVRRRLKPMFETRVRRTVYPVVDDERAIALAVDRGTISTGTRSQKLCEIEIELERGPPAVLFDVARELTQVLPARLAVKSKSERGYDIIDGEQELPVKAAPVDRPGGTSTRDAFQMIGLACLKQVINNEAALIKGDPEGVHQMRVGLRRLRAAMSLFSALLRDPQTEAIKTELKWLARGLGPARELEVLVDRVVAPMKRRGRRWRGMPLLSQEFAERRDVALKCARDAVQSTRFRVLTVDIAAWLRLGHGRTLRTTLFATRATSRSRCSRPSN